MLNWLKTLNKFIPACRNTVNIDLDYFKIIDWQSLAVALYPFSAMLCYTIFALFKKTDSEDLFFQFDKNRGIMDYKEKLHYLEEVNERDYLKEASKIEHYFSDDRFTDKEQELSDEVIINAYFNHFDNRWIALKKADSFMRIIFIITPLYFLFLWTMSFSKSKTIDDFLSLDAPNMFGVLLLASLVSFVTSILAFGFFSLGLTLLRFIFPNKGSIKRPIHIIDEFMRSFFYKLLRAKRSK